jgi:hypothetical protein
MDETTRTCRVLKARGAFCFMLTCVLFAVLRCTCEGDVLGTAFVCAHVGVILFPILMLAESIASAVTYKIPDSAFEYDRWFL